MSAQTPASSSRKRLLLGFTLLIVIAAVIYGAWAMFSGQTETTDDAYVHGNMVQVSAQIPGTVVNIAVDDTQLVQTGQALLSLDRADVDIALAQAQASLAQSVRKTRSLFAQNNALKADIAARQADAQQAKINLDKARTDLQRRQALGKIGGVSGEELRHAQSAVQAAQSALAQAQAGIESARARLETNKALTSGTDVSHHPDVQQAAEHYRQAWLARQRADLIAPVSGMVAQRSVQVGQHIAAGAPLMSIVPLDQLWIEANFKENQLQNMQPGQPVTLMADYYGKSVQYHGEVVGLSAGTGAAFALLPAQNASGNWIKVVQRLPVLIRLNPDELRKHPLRIGLSMHVTVDLDSTPAQALPDSRHGLKTDIYEHGAQDAQAQIDRIIQANLAS
ncbi:HlyD family efflux transporter periplasmic adaptor subunit [Alcaligenes sp. SDU_A2]|uniref:HlyD family efflux transporter periplasmic adaptor subunit n=1 Tax=Alcaligenes sp. SDU_A2 TaxID=3136634 RepID=UPI00311F96D0